jgi:hypothetical protein
VLLAVLGGAGSSVYATEWSAVCNDDDGDDKDYDNDDKDDDNDVIMMMMMTMMMMMIMMTMMRMVMLASVVHRFGSVRQLWTGGRRTPADSSDLTWGRGSGVCVFKSKFSSWCWWWWWWSW